MSHQAPTDAPSAMPLLSSAWLHVGSGHAVYYEQCGNPDGMPVVFLHGGPGSGCTPAHRRLFDLNLCHVTFIDQRGCGRSTPRGGLHVNTSDDLVADIETIRRHLNIDKWLVFGGSWGAGLALAYAAAHRDACMGLVLRGVFLGRAADVDWFFQQAKQFLPDAWNTLASLAPASARGALLNWLADGILSGDESTALARCLAWEAWESSVSMRQPAPPRAQPPTAEEASVLLHKYRIQSHYLQNGCFWRDPPLLARMPVLVDLPTAIVHGRLDWVCRPEAAWEVHQCLPGSQLLLLANCGHSPFESDMTAALLQAVRHFSEHGHFAGWIQTPAPAASAGA